MLCKSGTMLARSLASWQMAQTAVIKRLAIFAFAGFDVAGCAIAAKNRLAVGFRQYHGLRAIGIRSGSESPAAEW